MKINTDLQYKEKVDLKPSLFFSARSIVLVQMMPTNMGEKSTNTPVLEIRFPLNFSYTRKPVS